MKGYYGHTRRDYKQRKKKRKPDWHKSEFSNPYFTHNQPISLKPYLYFFLFTGIFMSLSYGLLFSKFLQINSININGTKYNDNVKQITNKYLNTKYFNLLSGANFFIFNSKKLEEEISNELLLKKVIVNKTLPNKLEISFENIKPAYTWIQNNQFFSVDADGLVGDQISSVIKIDQAGEMDVEKIKSFLTLSKTNLDLPIIYSTQRSSINQKDVLGNSEFFKLINHLNSQIPDIIKDDIILYKIDNDKQTKKIEISTEAGWLIYINTEDIDAQIKNLNSLMQKEFKNSQPTEYIDLRYGNKLYYK